MDWNVFFSSLAQSVGGLVGIFAAFIITKIINNQTEFDRTKTKVRDLLNKSQLLKDSGEILYFIWYCERQLAYTLEKVRTEMEANRILPPEEYYQNLNFPVYIPRADVLHAIQEKIDGGLPERNNLRHNSSEMRAIERSIADSVLEEGEKIESFRVEALHHTRTMKVFLAEIKDNPESSPLVSFSIIAAVILFFLGFIYPLSFLPLEAGHEIKLSFNAFFPLLLSFKGVMLLIPSLIFSVIMIVFYFVNQRLKYSANDIKEIRAATKLGHYSPYFDCMLKNEKEQEHWVKSKIAGVSN